MSPLEIFATIFTVACVGLANIRSTWQYPIGIIGTILFFFVFWKVGLMSSALLQVVFTFVQIYGWWFWLRGDAGSKPKITSFLLDKTSNNYLWYFGGLAVAIAACFPLGWIMQSFGAVMSINDACLFTTSILAQFWLDRKKLETWTAWGLVNAGSVYVYANQGLIVTTILYIGLFVNAFVGYYLWKKEFKGYGSAG